jgi:hypothetical protein
MHSDLLTTTYGTPSTPFSARLPFAHKLHVSPVGNICIFFGKLLVQNLTAKPDIPEALSNFSSVIQGKSRETTLN